jgi:hypothetical protein
MKYKIPGKGNVLQSRRHVEASTVLEEPPHQVARLVPLPDPYARELVFNSILSLAALQREKNVRLVLPVVRHDKAVTFQ